MAVVNDDSAPVRDNKANGYTTNCQDGCKTIKYNAVGIDSWKLDCGG